MRFVASVLVCIGIALATAGCDPVTDRKHFREGAGITLYADNGKAETQLQNQYIAYICEQAGVAVDTCGSGDTARLFVEAGMNDIDQRCDAYLTWLDMKRRDREPILRSLTQIGTATHTIMTASGAGTDSLEIVTAALGLAGGLYSNWNSRLLLSVNQSTVQTLVYSRQWQFRDAIKNERVTGRPRAVYLLRNYLRICMPTTIEADINTSTTLVQSGNPMDAKNKVVRKAQAIVITNARKPLPPTPPNLPPNPDGHTQAEKFMGPEEVANVQAALCVSGGGTDLGPDGSPTRLAIRDYLVGIQYRDVTEATQTINVDDRIRIKLSQVVKDVADCSNPAFGFANAYEVGRFGIPAAQRSNRIMTFQKKLKKFIETSDAGFPPPDITGKFDDKTRAAIAEYRKKATPPLPKDAPLDRQVDRALFIRVNAIRL